MRGIFQDAVQRVNSIDRQRTRKLRLRSAFAFRCSRQSQQRLCAGKFFTGDH